MKNLILLAALLSALLPLSEITLANSRTAPNYHTLQPGSTPGVDPLAHPPQNTQKAIGPKAALTALMANPLAAEIYRYLMMEKLATVLDFRLYKLFNYEDPISAAERPMLQAALAEQVRTQLGEDRLNHSFSNKGPGNQILLRAMQSAMRDLGYSEAQIQAMKIQSAFGPVNAYTYAFDMDSVVAVVFTELLNLTKNTPTTDLKGILAHENGHVIGQHVLSGLQLQRMLSRVANLAFVKDSENSPEGSEARQSLAGIHSAIEHEIVTNLIFPHSPSDENTSKKLKDAFGVVASKARTMGPQGGGIPKELEIELAQRFLLEVVRGLNTIEIPQSTKEFFANLVYLIPTTVRPNQQDFIRNARILIKAVSREKETTADNFALSVVGPDVSVRFHFAVNGGGGLPNDRRPTRKEIREAIARAQESVDDSVSNLTKEEMAQIIAVQGSDHPETNIRISNLAVLSRNYQILAMRNPFLRIVMLRDKVEARRKMLEFQISKIPAGKKSSLGDVLAEIKKLESTLTILIAEQIFDLPVNDSGPQSTRTNPRLNNLIEYKLNDRQFGLALLEFFTQMAAATAQDPMQKKYYDQKIAKTKAELEAPDSLITALVGAKGLSEQRKERLKILASKPSIAVIEQLRETMLAEQNASNRDTRVTSMDPSIRYRKSSAIHTDGKYRDEEIKGGNGDLGGLECAPILMQLKAF